MKRKLSADQAAARDARKARFREMAKQVAALSAEQKVELSKKCIGVTIDGRQLSAVNCMLLALQLPAATLVGGFRQWLKAGRCVRKGEHGAMIWIPKMKGRTKEIAADGSEIVDGEKCGFITGTVFDVAQTEEIGGQGVPQLALSLEGGAS